MKDPLWPSTKLRNVARRHSFGHKPPMGIDPRTASAEGQFATCLVRAIIRRQIGLQLIDRVSDLR